MAAPSELDVSEWDRNIQKYLPKSCRKRKSDIMNNIIAVAEGVKPSFLFDYAIADAEDLQMFLDRQDVTQGLKCLLLLDDVFVYNPTTLRTHLNCLEFSEEEHFLVDVSGELRHPRVVQGERQRLVKRHIGQLQTSLHEVGTDTCDSDKPLVIPPLDYEQWCIPTMFGVLLGYPAVYWDNGKIDGPANCLGMTPLIVHKICTEIRTNADDHQVQSRVISPTEIYSFSVPESLSPAFEKRIITWIDSVKQKVANSFETEERF
ncbi:UPF0739 protein C1orf74 homolog [Ptychodera flava]|uniref:UPF0739 protein C1orf74 homolog n=1 Tax=Ptychodera flava TaxID=63121 RepID=UPI003969E3FC